MAFSILSIASYVLVHDKIILFQIWMLNLKMQTKVTVTLEKELTLGMILIFLQHQNEL